MFCTQPSVINVTGNNVNITANLRFNSALQNDATCANAVVNGIRNVWSGQYTVLGFGITLQTTVNRVATNVRPSLPVNYSATYDISNGNNQRINMFMGDSRNQVLSPYTIPEFEWVAAHEFAH
jgi:hypothetical protein